MCRGSLGNDSFVVSLWQIRSRTSTDVTLAPRKGRPRHLAVRGVSAEGSHAPPCQLLEKGFSQLRAAEITARDACPDCVTLSSCCLPNLRFLTGGKASSAQLLALPRGIQPRS